MLCLLDRDNSIGCLLCETLVSEVLPGVCHLPILYEKKALSALEDVLILPSAYALGFLWNLF